MNGPADHEKKLEEKNFALLSLPNRMARLSKTHRPSTVTGARQLEKARPVK